MFMKQNPVTFSLMISESSGVLLVYVVSRLWSNHQPRRAHGKAPGKVTDQGTASGYREKGNHDKMEEGGKEGEMKIPTAKLLLDRLNRIGWAQYRNPDPQCTYPFTPDAIGYCWSFAWYIDEGKKFLKRNKVKSMEDICKGCECWKPAAPPVREEAQGR